MMDTIAPLLTQKYIELLKTNTEGSGEKMRSISAENANELAYLSLMLSDIIQRHWDFLRDRLSLGMDHRKVLEACRQTENMILGVSKNLETMIVLLQSPHLVKSLAGQLARLKARHQTAQELLEKANALRVWAESPMPPINESKIGKKGNPLTGEGFRSVDKIIQDLQQKQQK
jgi:hypothetical protein